MVEKKTKRNSKKETADVTNKYKEHIEAGMSEYLLTQGGKMGIIFAGIIFMFDYFGVFGGEVEGAGTYLFYGIFFGLFAGLWSWHVMKKKLKEKRA